MFREKYPKLLSNSATPVRLHGARPFRTTPERLYRAFLDAPALCKWLPPHGFTGTVHSIDARAGGSCHMSFTNFSTGSAHSFRIEYRELKPNESLHYVDRFDDPNLPGAMPVHVQLRAVPGGTELRVTQEGIPDAIPVAMCYMGWQESLDQLKALVEPEIPDGA